MGRVNKDIIYATLSLVVVSVVCVVLSHFWIENFYEAIITTVIISIAFGYIITSTLLSAKKQQDKNLEHLTKEILHELNIPISTIQLNTSLLHKSIDDEKLLKRVTRVEDATKRLQRLYKELSYTIKKEISAISKEEFCLKELIENRIEIFDEFQRNKFVLSLQPYSIYTDKIGFEKAFDNIISNAMKYSSKDSTIEITLQNHTLSIKDNGIGMDEVELLRVFERYYQADKKKDGKGIGLAIVKEFCDSNFITIDISSTKYQGTTIKLLFDDIATIKSY